MRHEILGNERHPRQGPRPDRSDAASCQVPSAKCLSEATLSPAEAAAALPGPPNVNTVLRWLRFGVRVAGKPLRLPARKVGGRWRIRPADLADFIQATTAGAIPAAAARARVEARCRKPLADADRRRRRRLAGAMIELHALGVTG